MSKKPFAAALRQITAERGRGINSQCAAAIQVSPGYFSELRNGGKEGSEAVRRAIAAYFEMSYEEFLDYGRSLIGEPKLPARPALSPHDNPAYTAVFKARPRLAAGAGSFVIEDTVGDQYFFRTDWLSSLCSPHQAVLFDVDGISMYPTINHGDTVLIDRGRTEFENDRIFAIGIQDRVLLKRLRLTAGGKIAVVSDNEDKRRFPTEEVEPQEIRILGHAVWHAGTL